MEGSRIQRSDLPADFVAQQGTSTQAAPTNVTPIRRPATLATPVDERADVLDVLNACRWNMSAAARALGICRPSLYRVLRRLGIPPLKDQLAQGVYQPA
jgi:transcriptional regulator of acetoin/glycerol metabolism